MFLFTLEMLSIGYACSKSSLNFTWYQTKLERIHCVFGYGDGDKNVRALGSALCDLLHHNTDLEGEYFHSSLSYFLTLYQSQSTYLLVCVVTPDFLDLIRASKPQANDEDSPKSSGVRLFEWGNYTLFCLHWLLFTSLLLSVSLVF